MVAAVVVSLGACGGPDALDVQVHNGTTALVSTTSGQGSDAEVHGVLQTSSGNCLGLLTEGAEQPVPVIWPRGSTLTEDGDGVDVPGVGVVRIGQTVLGAGGEVSSPTGVRYSEVPEECLGEDLLIEATTIRSATP